MVMRKLFNGAGLAAAALLAATPAWAQDMLGQPVPGAAHLQEGGSPIYREAIWFHNVILMPIIVLICLFVLGLLITIVVKFNRKANPTPSRTTHNTALEVVWTVLPVLILMGISIFSFRLLYRYHDMPKRACCRKKRPRPRASPTAWPSTIRWWFRPGATCAC
jgi:cytochrome c oxidase subunit 2